MKKNKIGQFIVVEGMDGSGKTKICKIIKNILIQNNIKNILVREPGSTPIAEKIRNIIKNNYKYEYINKKTILLLMYAARNQLVKNIIKPALKNNIWVISDRHDLSSLAYQGGGFQINKKIIYYLKKITIGSFIPDLTIYLNILPKIAIQRIYLRKKIDIIEKNNLNFFIRIKKSYSDIIQKISNLITIDANLKINIVNQDIKNKLQLWINTCK